NPEIENILGRVTGGDASVINGLIKVTGSNANLYLMNPAGIIFGNGARLDVPGSFHATTASGIGFGLVNWFKAFGKNDYASLVGNFDYSVFTQGGTILNSGNLEVKEGQSLTLSGETVISTGTLKAPGGNINIRTLPEDTLVRIKQKGNLLSLSVSVNFPLPEEITNQSFTALSLPQLLTGGNLNNATGIEVENGVVKLTGSGTEIPDNAGIFISNNINTEGETNGNINISSESGNIILDGLNEPLNLFGDVEIEAYGSNSFIFLGSNINSFGDVKIEANGSNSFVILNGNINSSGDVQIENIFSRSSKNTVILGGNINSSGDVEIELGIIMGGDITTNGGDITVEKISNFIKDITISTGEEVAGDIRISSFSEKNQGINNDFKPYNLTLISGTGDVDNYVRGKGIKNLNIDGNNVELSASNIAGNINVKASNDIEINPVEANGDITLEAERDINMPKAAHLKLQTEKDINIIAGNKVEVRDSDDTQATISAGNNLLIQGDKRINIQAFNNKDSKLTSGNDLTLISDGLITGDTKFFNGGNFSTISVGGGRGNFEQTFTPNSDNIISSEGDVNFGNYSGPSLKIEAKGSITGGDITINGINRNTTFSDPDIELLTR
ncbi:MAG: filamentous hemagglutinin N-terminal domain-containing protein, partial [Cyanobacteria bacterium J06573_2]